MPEWGWTVVGVVAGFVVLWLGLIFVLWVQQRRAGHDVDWRSLARLAPDVIRLIKRLAADPTVPRGTRWWLGGLLFYLLLPIDLVPDFLPAIGYADDVIITALALRYAVRRAGREAVARHWPGTPEGLESVLALARIPA